jgi:hypothetical protein
MPSASGTSGSTAAGSPSGGAVSAGGASGSTAAGSPSGAGGSTSTPGTSPGCPAEKPTEATECTRGNPAACVYDDGGCVCAENAWDCYADADCPAAAPADAEACTLGGMACSYEGLNCTCSTTNGWTCLTPCPEAAPADSASCRRPANNTCRYDDAGALVQGFGTASSTTCSCAEGAFNCFTQADCPAAPPANESECAFPTLSCAYDGQECDCDDGVWACETDCPAMEPADGTACVRDADDECRYLAGAPVEGGGGDADATCRCEEGTFNCFGAEDCPATAPATGGGCEFATLTCEYTGLACDCEEEGTWTCMTDCPAAVPAQASACERAEEQTCRYNADVLVQGFGGSAEAVCACREQMFDCLTATNCPATQPAADADCTGLTGLACTYGEERCSCGQDAWTCQTQCPMAPPAAGAACNRPATSACEYAAGALVGAGAESDNTCVCNAGAFTCYSAADCPATAPASDTACEQPGLECEFDTQSCRCRTSTSAWSCEELDAGAGGSN